MSGEMGFLVGSAMGDARNRSNAHAEALADIRAKIANVNHSVVYQRAFKVAAAIVHEEIIEELRLKEEGIESPARLSDPANVDGRNLAYANNAVIEVVRLSGQKMSMSRISIERVRRARALD